MPKLISHSENLVKWSSQAISFWKHQFALIYHKIFLIPKKINSFITKSLRKLFLEDIFWFFGLWNFCMSKNFFLLIYTKKKTFITIVIQYFTATKKIVEQYLPTVVKTILKWKKKLWSVRKINKTYGQKEFLCVWRRPIEAFKHTFPPRKMFY